MIVSEKIKLVIKNIPEKTGVYQYYDKTDKLLYVGKAKNLKKRVRSYFTKSHKSNRLKILVKKIEEIKYVLVVSEMDALLLENSLIKEHKPTYNVMLRDDKTYPWICIKNERFPRVFMTRRVIKDGSDYFGPYTSTKIVSVLLKLCHQLYPLRSCNYNLSQKNIENKKFTVCLEYHIDNCLGPCVGEQSNEEYLNSINHIRKIIQGDLYSVKQSMKKEMKRFAEKMEFEKAQEIKESLDLLIGYQSKSMIVNPKITDVDVFSIYTKDDLAFINYLKIDQGSVTRSQNLEIKKKLNESDERLLELAIIELRARFNSSCKKVYSSINIETSFEDFSVIVPKIGDKKRVIDLSLRNAKSAYIEKLNRKEQRIAKRGGSRVLNQLKKDLNLAFTPKHIECFDISNIQGENPIASCVVFKNGKPSKKDYRYFKIKTVDGIDDFASIEEVVYRRYYRILKEKGSLADFIIIDGGKGQLSSAVKSLKKLKLYKKVGVIGVAKRLEEIFFPEISEPLYLDKRSESIRLIKRVRDEAHRFAITNHRKQRDKTALELPLQKIKGFGKKTIEKLIQKYGSIKNAENAEKQELEDLIGKKKTIRLLGISDI